MNYKIFEFKIPVFFSCLGSLILCALLTFMWQETLENFGTETRDLTFGAAAFELAEESSADAAGTLFLGRAEPQGGDFILELYRQPAARDRVIDFFEEICPSREITGVILANADIFNVSPALAFALAWEESRFNPLAVNNKNRDESVDRGLFQLNDRSFPRLEIPAFFNPSLNAYYGMSHLRHCLDTGGTEIAALAMYNAGTGRVRNSGTPKTTLDYVSRILENRKTIESCFLESENRFHRYFEDAAEIAEAESGQPRFVRLMPLGIR